MKNFLFGLLTLCMFVQHSNLIAQTINSDPSFNVIDDCTYGNGESFDEFVYTTQIQPDGKVLVGGAFTIYNGVSRNCITRLNSDGTLDQSFNPGTGCTNFFTSYNPTYVHTIAVQSDGKIIVAGNFLKYNGFICNGLVRLNSDGSIDKSFNVGSGLNAPAFKVLIQPNGKILIAGNFTTYNGVSRSRIARIHANGSLDTTFKPGSGFNNYVKTITLLSNGKIMVGGIFNTYNGNTAISIARLKSDGSFDAGFVSGSGFQSEVTTILPTNNGRLIVMGFFISYKSTFNPRVIKLDSNGNVDNTFNIGGSFNNGVLSGAIQPDGKIIAVGNFTEYDYKTTNRICRLNTNGSLDTSFKSPFDYVVGDAVYSASLESSGRIIIGGNFACYGENKNILNHISRLNTDGSVEQDYNHGTGFQVAEVSSFVTTSNQSIYAGGTFYSYNGFLSPGVVRLFGDGQIDTSFVSPVKYGSAVNTLSLQSDGKLIVGGGYIMAGSITPKCIARLNTDGSVDTTFQIGTGTNSHVYTTAIQSDGKIILGGNFTTFKDSSITRIVRVYPNGIIDKSFNVGTSFNDIVYKILIQPDGKILVCGRFTKYNNVTYPGIIRLLEDGRIDSTFITGAGMTNGFPSSGGAFAYNMTLQNDGKIIMVGNFIKYNNWSGNGIVRILPNGRYDSSFSVGPAFDVMPYDVIVQSDGKVLVGGRFTTYRNASRNGIVRILPNGAIDATFNPGTGFDRYTKALAFHNGERILVGGEFTQFNGACRTRIARLLNCESLSKQVVNNCGPYLWTDGKTYSSSTKAPYLELNNANANGCDSFVVLNLTVNQPKYAEQIIKSCGSYKWIDGITYTASTDTVKHIISGGANNGCDSIISLKLTVNQPTNGYDPIIACKKYKWIDGVTYTSSNNTATYTFPGGSYNGCDSILHLSLGIIKVTTTVSKNLTFLTSNEFGATYQWLNCDSAKKPIQGATDRTYEALETGNYAVVVTKDNCTDTSDCIEVIVDNTSVHASKMIDLSVYPNPSNGLFNIESSNLNQFKKIVILDQLGREINTIMINESNSVSIDLSGLKGVFYIEIKGENNSVYRKKIVVL